MSKVKLSLSILIITIALVLAWVFIPTHVRLGNEILNQSIGDGYKLVGHKAISTDPQAGKLNHFFLIDQSASVSDSEPFLITSDPFITVTKVDDNKLSLLINGRVKFLDNDLWIERPDGTVQHWYVSANINYVR
ncbi:hypothetical protein [Vibrio sinaloensis]|uniref:hypothetical protein n=1 Tax=Photobacterium sp. (strain ATCC 43367) TaxID=379097 RepID=UPI0022AFB812|nr:hypothetical protein [Vibrio sinaloensis]MCZ4292653.1 hypothetical protein [Vibrio sinaloensis]